MGAGINFNSPSRISHLPLPQSHDGSAAITSPSRVLPGTPAVIPVIAKYLGLNAEISFREMIEAEGIPTLEAEAA